MATEVENKSCLPEYYTMNHLSEDWNNNWSRDSWDKDINEHLYDEYMRRQVNVISEHEKEMMKQTMLEHEATFRNQVFELHRLYRIQKNLMVECETRNFDGSLLPPFKSQSNILTYPVQSECSQLIWQSSPFHEGNNCYGKKSTVDTSNLQTKTGYLEGNNGQSYSFPIMKNCSLTESRLVENNAKKHCRRMFDLHLPAEAYIDLENVDTSGKNYVAGSVHTVPFSPRKTCVDYQQNDASLTLCSDNGHFSNLRTGNILRTDSTFKIFGGGRPEKDDFAQYLDPSSASKMNQGHHITKSTSTSEYKLGHKLASSDFTLLHEESRREWEFLWSETGRKGKAIDLFSEAPYHDKYSAVTDKLVSSFRRTSDNGSETSAETRLTRLNSSRPVSSSMPSLSSVPVTIFSNSSLFKSSWIHPQNSMHNTYALQELGIGSSNATNMSFQNYAAVEICQHSRSLNPAQGAALATSKLDVVPEHGHGPSEFSKDIKLRSLNTQKRLNLNQVISSIEENSGLAVNEDLGICIDQKKRNLSGGTTLCLEQECSSEPVGSGTFLPEWDLNITIDQHQVKSHSGEFSLQSERKEENKLGFSESSKQYHSSPLQIIDPQTQLNGVSDHENRSTHELPDNIQQPNLFPEHVSNKELPLTYNGKCKERDGIESTGLSSEFRISSSKKQIDIETCISDKSKETRDHLDLNLEVSCSEEEKISETEVEKLQNSIASFSTKSDLEIDLEEGRCQAACHIADISLGKGCSTDIIVRMAAENIIAMSGNHNNISEETNGHLLPPCNTLHWFVDFAVSNSEALDRLECGKKYLPNDQMDIFEAMTLQLEEIPSVEYSNNPLELVNQHTDGEGIGAASLLFTKHRRGQARRRRQRKDFQKDILPCLASLSKFEVSEDIQVIEELMQASGSPWQSRLKRRRIGRKRAGKRQHEDSGNMISEIVLNPDPPTQPTSTELEVTGSTIIGWGRTTKRCRRQRTFSGNLVTPLA